jgi:hypothetical protein
MRSGGERRANSIDVRVHEVYLLFTFFRRRASLKFV